MRWCRGVTVFLHQTIFERVMTNLVAMVILLALGLVAWGFLAAVVALRRFLGVGLAVALALGLFAGCVPPACVCSCPYSDPTRLHRLEGEVDRLRARAKFFDDVEKLDTADKAASDAAKGGAR
jgi:hypothetical protein